MISDELVDKATLAGLNAIRAHVGLPPLQKLDQSPAADAFRWRMEYRVALEAVGPDIRSAALEEAIATVLEANAASDGDVTVAEICRDIRALKTQTVHPPTRNSLETHSKADEADHRWIDCTGNGYFHPEDLNPEDFVVVKFKNGHILNNPPRQARHIFWGEAVAYREADETDFQRIEPMAEYMKDRLVELAAPLPPIVAGATAVLHAGKYAMIFNPDGTLEFPQFETYPDSVKAAAKILCEHVSVAYKTLAAERDYLLAELRRRNG